MPKKLTVVGIFLLAVFSFSLCIARISEAVPTPDKIIASLNARLDSILSAATNRRNELSNKVTTQVNKFNAGKISRSALCSELDNLEDSSSDARDRFNRKIAKATQKKTEKLQKVGADPSYITTAEDMEDDAHTDKHALYDVLDTEIDNAKQVPSPWCT